MCIFIMQFFHFCLFGISKNGFCNRFFLKLGFNFKYQKPIISQIKNCSFVELVKWHIRCSFQFAICSSTRFWRISRHFAPFDQNRRIIAPIDWNWYDLKSYRWPSHFHWKFQIDVREGMTKAAALCAAVL